MQALSQILTARNKGFREGFAPQIHLHEEPDRRHVDQGIPVSALNILPRLQHTLAEVRRQRLQGFEIDGKGAELACFGNGAIVIFRG